MTFVSKYNETETAAIVQEYQSGADRHELCKKYGIKVRTLFRWQAKFGNHRPELLKLVQHLHAENSRLKEEIENRTASESSALKRRAAARSASPARD